MIGGNSNIMAAAAAVLGMASIGHGLVTGNRQSFVTRRIFSRRRRPSSPMAMYIDDMTSIASIDIPSLSQPLPTMKPISFVPSNPFTTTLDLITSDPQLEVELLDVSNAALDVSTLLGSKTVWLRLYNVIGRVLVLSADSIREAHIPLDEWAFHASMLAISLHLFLRSAEPLLLAVSSVSGLTVRDRRAYSLLFEAVGLTVLQFKALLSTRTMEWVEIAPNEAAELDGDMYFLYCGEVAIPSTMNKMGHDNMNVAISAKPDNVPDGESLDVSDMIFGDVQFAKALEASLQKRTPKAKSKAAKSAAVDDRTRSHSPSGGRFVVGAAGAAMLRISQSKLLRLMQNDAELSSSVQRLVLLCMQEKLSRTLREDGLKLSSKKCGR